MTTNNTPSKSDTLPIVSNGVNMKTSINSMVGASDWTKYLTTYMRTLDARSQGVGHGGFGGLGTELYLPTNDGFTHLGIGVGSNQSYSGSGSMKLSAFSPTIINDTVSLSLANASDISYDAKALLYFISNGDATLTLRIKSYVEGGEPMYSPDVAVNLISGMNEVVMQLTDVATVVEAGQTLNFQLEYTCNNSIVTPAGEVGILFIYNIWDSLDTMPEREDKLFFPFGNGHLEGVIV